MSSLRGFASSCACGPLLPVQAVTSENRRHKSRFFVCLSHTPPSCDPDLMVARYSYLHHSGVTAVLDGRVRACCLSSSLDGLKLCDTSGLREVQSVEVLHRVVRLAFGRHLWSSSESPAFFVVDASRAWWLVVRTGAVVVKLPSAPCGRTTRVSSTQISGGARRGDEVGATCLRRRCDWELWRTRNTCCSRRRGGGDGGRRTCW
jgi:hypothetical protein